MPASVREWLKTVQHQPTKPGEPWGLFTFSADSRIPYCIVSTCLAWSGSSTREGIEKLPGYHPKAKAEMAAWVQKFQDPKTHQFIDPLHESCVPHIDDPNVRYTFREAVTKYAVVLLNTCGAKPLYPYTPGANEEGKFDPGHYLKFIKSGDWDKQPWGIGSHAALQTVHLFEMVNAGRDDLIPPLIEGTEFILSKQNPRTGMWGTDQSDLCQQIGGAVKVIGRFQWYMGLISPHMDKLADAIIANHRSGAFYATDASPCVPRNVDEMAYACMEASDYRRDELRAVFVGLIGELKRYSRADGSFSETWGGTNAVGWCQSVVSPRANKPRADLVGTQLVMDTLVADLRPARMAGRNVGETQALANRTQRSEQQIRNLVRRHRKGACGPARAVGACAARAPSQRQPRACVSFPRALVNQGRRCHIVEREPQVARDGLFLRILASALLPATSSPTLA